MARCAVSSPAVSPELHCSLGTDHNLSPLYSGRASLHSGGDSVSTNMVQGDFDLCHQSEYSDLSYTVTETHIITLRLLHDQHAIHPFILYTHSRLLSNNIGKS